MLTFHAMGDWPPEQVSALWKPETRVVNPQVERLVEAAWNAVGQNPRVQLFDGPMCRMNSWRADEDSLRLHLGPTSYRWFLGTNLTHPQLADRFGPDVLANPVGVSPALLTTDGFLLFGCRNASVAYYPNHIHPFAGALEPKDVRPDLGGKGDVFAAVRRELAEELSLHADDLTELHCTGIAEDHHIRQPELIFRVRTRLTRAELESRLDRREHNGSWSVAARADDVQRAIAEAVRYGSGHAAPAVETAGKTTVPMPMTPVAMAALLLFGRVQFAGGWFERNAAFATMRWSDDCQEGMGL